MSFIQFWIAVAILITVLFATQPVDKPDCAPEGDGCRVERVVALPDPDTAAKGWVPVETNGVYGVIVPDSDADEFAAQADDYWTPTPADIELAEAALFEDQGGIDRFRQYYGTVEDGKQKILINGFCDAFDRNWYQESVFVLDGGDCYFHATYDVETDTIEGFYFNGNA
jgi:hypothetical protein